MEHTQNTTPQDLAASPTTIATKTVRFTVQASDSTPFAYSAEVELPADAEAYCREFIRQFDSPTRIPPAEVGANTTEGMRMHDKYGEKKLQSFMHATEAMLLAEGSTPPPTPPRGDGAPAGAASKVSDDEDDDRSVGEVIESLMDGEADDFFAMEETASFTPSAEDEDPIHGTPGLGLQLGDWHDGQTDPVYAVGSCFRAGRPSRRSDVEAASRNLRKERNAECDELAAQLDRLLTIPQPPRTTPTQNLQDSAPAVQRRAKHAPELITFFRRVLENGPLGILDDYAEVGNAHEFLFLTVTERDRVTGKPELVYSPEEAERLQDEHDELLFSHFNERMIDAAEAVNKGEAGSPDGDARPARLTQIQSTAARIHPTAQEEIRPASEPDPDYDPDGPWRDMDGNAVPDYEEDAKAIRLALKVIDANIELNSRIVGAHDEHDAADECIAAADALESLLVRMDAYAESQKTPNPSLAAEVNAEMLAALEAAEEFLAGFEDDDTQDGIKVRLQMVRRAIANARAAAPRGSN